MIKFCPVCATANIPGALYCAKCGTAVDAPARGALPEDISQRDIVRELPRAVEPMQEYEPEKPKSGSNWPVIVAVVATFMMIGGLYYWLFLADDMNGSSGSSYAASADEDVKAEARQFFVMTEANIRDRATTMGSNILGKMPRGSAVTGVVKLGEDNISEWLELADGKGFIATVNLGETEPPEIVRSLNDLSWTADAAVEIWAQANTASNLLDRASEGTKITLSGLTANDFIEVKLRKGGIGYLADGAAILGRLGGKPVNIAFNPQTCNFGSELGAEFAKIGAQLKAQWQALEDKEFADDEARDKAYAAAEGKSSYAKLSRSYDGLSVTALGQHYESQSVYFADPPAKVIEVFRANGFQIDRNGNFPSTELYAGISATRGEGAAYGKSELGCGV